MNSVSVIIPNYNRARVIGETLSNVLSQSLPPDEVIVVDDGSSDDSVAVIRGFGDRVTLLQQANKGPGAARNAGLQKATGDFIQFMDSDDLMSLNKLELQCQALAVEAADIIYGPWMKAWMDNGQIRPDNVVLQQRPLPDWQSPLYWFLTSWSMVFQQCLIRRSALEKVGGYREDMRVYEDSDLFVRLLLSGAKLAHEADSLTFYRLEDYGKLTASGVQNDARAIDIARFYSLVIQQLRDYPQYQDILGHIRFRARAWHALQSLTDVFNKGLDNRWRENEAEIKNDIEWLEPYRDGFKMQFWTWYQQKQKGVQQRIKGHRWSMPYQTSHLTPYQSELIRATCTALP